MRKINFKEQVLPHLLIIIFFIIIVSIYFIPAFSGKEIKQHDILQSQGGSKEIIDYREKTGKEALWTNSMFSGMPAYLISTTFNGEFIKRFFSEVQYFFPHPSGLLLINLICFYILLLAYGVRPVYAAIGAIAFGFSSFSLISIEAGHNNKIKALGYAPLILAGVVWVFKGRYLLGFVVAALGVMLNIGANHYQITYYFVIALVIYGISEFIFAVKEKRIPEFLKCVGILVLAAGLGLATNIASFWSTYEYSLYSSRGKSEITTKVNPDVNVKGGLERDYAFHWSYGKFETFTMIIPNLYGGASVGSLSTKSEVYKTLTQNYPQVNAREVIERLPLYWGDQSVTGGPTYYGAIICFLFVLGMLVLDNRTRYWILAATIFSILLSWGKNLESLNYFLFEHLPGYNKFRSVSMTLVVAQLCASLGGILALHKILETPFTKEIQKKILIAFAATGGLCFLFFLFAGSANYSSASDTQVFGEATQLIDALREDRKQMLKTDALRSFVLILIAAALIFAAVKNKLNKRVAVIIVGVLVLVDLWFVDKRYLNNDDFQERAVENYFAPTAADQEILKDQTLNYRVLNLRDPFNEAKTSYFHKSVGGYHGAKMKRYQDLINNAIAPEMNVLIDRLKKGSTDFSGLNAINMLNTRYFLFSEEANGVLKNDKALGNAWFVKKIKKVNSADEEILALKNLDPAETAVVDISKFKIKIDNFNLDSASTIKLVEYSPNTLKYESNSSSEGFAVLSEIYYPEGWEAFIDGKPVEILRANYVLRAIEIPAGKHSVELKFEPRSFYQGNTIASISNIILLVCCAGVVFYSFKNAVKTENGSSKMEVLNKPGDKK